ncbi:MAG: polysaccharide deacetylase family protein [Nitrospira sp.]|nr:polysaccharide deacetylase family protein [Nitrospira sp.]
MAVLMYHRVLAKDEVTRYPVQSGMYVLDTVFAQQMSFVNSHFTVLSLQELLDLWGRGEWNDQARYCVITFDDGWLDNYRHAYPVLKQLRMPATIFLPTDYVGRNEWFWPDQLAVLCKSIADSKQRPQLRAAVAGLFSDFVGEGASRLVEAVGRHELVSDDIIERCKHLPIKRIRELIHALASELRVTLPLDRVIVNWDEVREMSRGGVSFGSHSCTHRIMTTITSDEVSEELVRSRQVLFDQGVNYVPVYCYPNGNSNASIEKLVKANGYEAAVSVRMGFEGSCPENRYAIRRVGIHNDISGTIPLFSFRLFGPQPSSA